MLERDRIEATLLAWLQDATNCEAIMAERDTATPQEPYLTLKLQGPRFLGQALRDIQETGTGNYAFRYFQECELTAEVRAYSPRTHGVKCAQELISRVQDALALNAVRAKFESEGLVPRHRGTLIDSNELIGTQWRGRASVDVLFGIRDVIVEQVDSIERADIVGSVNP